MRLEEDPAFAAAEAEILGGSVPTEDTAEETPDSTPVALTASVVDEEDQIIAALEERLRKQKAKAKRKLVEAEQAVSSLQAETTQLRNEIRELGVDLVTALCVAHQVAEVLSMAFGFEVEAEVVDKIIADITEAEEK